MQYKTNFYPQSDFNYTNHANPINEQEVIFGGAELSTLESDEFSYSKDDGIISTKDKAKNFLKGVISPVTNMFQSPKNFAIGLAAIVGGGLLIAATGGTAAPLMVTAGIIGGGVQFGKSAYMASKAKTDAEAETAWQGMGAGTSAVAMSVAGAKSALKATGADTQGMSAIQATVQCIKQTPQGINGSINAFRSGQAVNNIKNIFNTKKAPQETKKIEQKAADTSTQAETEIELQTKQQTETEIELQTKQQLEIEAEAKSRIAQEQQIQEARNAQDALIEEMQHPSKKSAAESANIFEENLPETENPSYKSSFVDENGVVKSKKQIQKIMSKNHEFTKKLINDEISVSDLTDEEILDIWSWREYDFQLRNYPEIQEAYIERFNTICKNNTIRTRQGESLVRTIPAEIDTSGEFSIGKPLANPEKGNWPAAAARMQLNEDQSLPVGLLERLRDDKSTALSLPNAENTPSSVFIIDQQESSNVLTGFDWETTGIIEKGTVRNGFGSSAFRREVNPITGLSTEVNFPGDTKFILNPEHEVTVLQETTKEGIPFLVKIFHIIPKN